MQRNAIISVFDKKNLDLIANFLISKKFTIYSSGNHQKVSKICAKMGGIGKKNYFQSKNKKFSLEIFS